jgi:hypothetical protein
MLLREHMTFVHPGSRHGIKVRHKKTAICQPTLQ